MSLELKNKNLVRTKQTFQKSSTIFLSLSSTPFPFFTSFLYFSILPFTSHTEGFQLGSNNHCMTPNSGSEDDMNRKHLFWRRQNLAWTSRVSFCVHSSSGSKVNVQTMISQQRTLKLELVSLFLFVPLIVISTSSRHLNPMCVRRAGNGLKSWDLSGK